MLRAIYIHVITRIPILTPIHCHSCSIASINLYVDTITRHTARQVEGTFRFHYDICVHTRMCISYISFAKHFNDGVGTHRNMGIPTGKIIVSSDALNINRCVGVSCDIGIYARVLIVAAERKGGIRRYVDRGLSACTFSMTLHFTNRAAEYGSPPTCILFRAIDNATVGITAIYYFLITISADTAVEFCAGHWECNQCKD